MRILRYCLKAKATTVLLILFAQRLLATGQDKLFTLTSLHKMLNSKPADVIRLLDSAGYKPVTIDAAGNNNSASPIFGSTSGWRDAHGKQILFEYCDPSYIACIGFEIDTQSSTIVMLAAYGTSPADSLAEKINYQVIPKGNNVFVNEAKDCVLTIDTVNKKTLTTFSRNGYGNSRYFLDKKKKGK